MQFGVLLTKFSVSAELDFGIVTPTANWILTPMLEADNSI